MRIFMMTDLEGVAGVVSYPIQTKPEGAYYEAARKLLTAEVNAAVAALAEEGVEEVLVVDGHGPGAICFEDLLEPAVLMHGRPIKLVQTMRLVRDYDACVMIGQHAMAGTPEGNLTHTQNMKNVEYYKLNDRPIGEIAQFALYVGAFGKPVIFLSGDEAACREIQDFIPQATTAAVKKGLGHDCAVCVSAARSHRLIAEGVKGAIRKYRQSPVPALVWPGPFVSERRFRATEHADAAMKRRNQNPERVDPFTVRYRSENLLDIIY